MALTSSKVFNVLIQNDEFKEKFIKSYVNCVPLTPTFDDPSNLSSVAVDNVQIWTYDGTHNMNGAVSVSFLKISWNDYANGWIAHCAIQYQPWSTIEFSAQWQEKNVFIQQYEFTIIISKQ